MGNRHQTVTEALLSRRIIFKINILRGMPCGSSPPFGTILYATQNNVNINKITNYVNFAILCNIVAI